MFMVEVRDNHNSYPNASPSRVGLGLIMNRLIYATWTRHYDKENITK